MKIKPSRSENDQRIPVDYWSLTPQQLLSILKTTDKGITSLEAQNRLKQYGQNVLEKKQEATALRLFLNQFRSPLVLILIFAAIISIVVGEWTDASIVLALVFGSTILWVMQEYSATYTEEKLRSQVTIKSNVLRYGQLNLTPSHQNVHVDG